MAAKRKCDDEPAAITYGSEVPWLQCIVHISDPHRSEGFWRSGLSRDPALTTFTNKEVVAEASKVLYLLHHQLDNSSEVFQYLGLNSGSHEHRALTRQLNLRQSQWKGAILNKFLLPHVKELVRKWHVANAWRSFTSLSDEERQQVWMDAYDEDPKGIATSMFKPVIGVLDTFNTFNRDLDFEQDRAKMKAVRIMLRNKYLFGCETTYEHRIRTERKDTCFNDWVAYSSNQDFASTLVAVADMPITSTLLSVQSGSTSKKAKMIPEI